MKRAAIIMMIGVLATFCIGCNNMEEKHSREETVVLDFPSWQATYPGAQEFWEYAIEEFENRHPNVEINMYQVSFENYIDTLNSMFVSGNPPDITHIPTRYFYQFQDKGWFADLKQCGRIEKKIEGWNKLQDSLKVDGRYYGIIMLANGYTMYYNKRMLQDAEVPVDMHSFLESAEHLTKDEDGDGIPEVYGFGACQSRDTNFYNEATSFVVGNGGEWAKNGDLSSMLSANTIEALEAYQSVFANGCTMKRLSVEQKRQFFMEGKIAIIFDGPWVASYIESSMSDYDSVVGVARIPFRYVPGSVSNSLHIPSGISEERKRLVGEFMELLTEKEFQEHLSRYMKTPPPDSTAVTENLLQENAFLRQFIEDAQEAREIMPSGYEAVYSSFTEEILLMLDTIVSEPYPDVKEELLRLKNKLMLSEEETLRK